MRVSFAFGAILVLCCLVGCATKKTSVGWKQEVDDWNSKARTYPSKSAQNVHEGAGHAQWGSEWFDEVPEESDKLGSVVADTRTDIAKLATINPKNKVALVIGNSAYKTSRLKNPSRDASDVAKSLRSLGFTVIQKNNVTLREMDKAMGQLYASLKDGGIGLFYYAGHGVQVEGENYLVPVDATIDSESDAKFECMNAGRILGKMEDAGNSMNIVILDACRNNPFARSFRSASRGLARMDAPTGAILAYSTAPGSIANDGSGRNGVYTKYLLRHMKTPGLDINNVFIRTRMDVINETGGKQVPWESSSLTGLFYFAGQKSE